MRTVHETEALRPSDPVPKHHSSNPMNKYQRLKLVLSGNKKEKSSTPASPSSHQPPTAPIPSTHDADYAHNNVVYFQDLGSPGTPTMIQFPPDINFTEHELSLPAPDLFRLLRRQLHWAQEEGEELRAEAERLEKKRKEEWVAKELLFENYMEAELSTVKRRRIESTLPDDTEAYDLIEEDIGPSKALDIEPKAGKLPWWRTQEWVEKMAAPRETKEDISKETTPPQAAEEHPTIETEQAEKA